METYLVTGGAGFIGSNIVDALVQQGHNVRVIDNLSTGSKNNIIHVLDKIDFIEGDIRDTAVVRSAADGVDYILHQAAIPSVPRSFEDPRSSLQVNGAGTLELLKAGVDNKVKCFVYASSSSVYGDKNDFHPKSPYGVSKLLGEQYCLLYNKLYKLNTVCLRYYNVFGPRQNPDSQYAAVIPKFIKKMIQGESPVIYGDGKQSRDFTYVNNVVKANLSIRKSGVYNIACGRSTSLNELFSFIKDILRVSINPVYADARPGDIKFSCAEIDETIYKPDIYLKEGLILTINYMKSVKT